MRGIVPLVDANLVRVKSAAAEMAKVANTIL